MLNEMSTGEIVCVCVSERERERGEGGKGGMGGKRDIRLIT